MKIVLIIAIWLLMVAKIRTQIQNIALFSNILNLSASDCGVGTHPCNTPDLNALRMILVANGFWYSYSLTSDGAREMMARSPFKRNLNATVYSVGYASPLVDDVILKYQATATALNINFLIVDATIPFGGILLDPKNYIRAAQETVCVGRAVAVFLRELCIGGALAPNLIHLIGSSLGAPAMHFAAVHFSQIYGSKVFRLTALEMARPCFDPDPSIHVRTGDADRVDSIHTNSGIEGTTLRVADADFDANGGSKQPGTIIFTQDHARVLSLYAESITSMLCIGRNGNGVQTKMGYFWDGTPGLFSITTNGFSPYCRG